MHSIHTAGVITPVGHRLSGSSDSPQQLLKFAAIKLLAKIVELQAAEPAMIKLASGHPVQEIEDAAMHPVNTVAAPQKSEIHGMTPRTLHIVNVPEAG